MQTEALAAQVEVRGLYENVRALCSQERQATFQLPTGLEGTSPDQKDTTAQMEAAAAQLEAATRQREAETREGAIQEVEMVLQTYFHNLDNTYNKLATINENMDDVEVSKPGLMLGRQSHMLPSHGMKIYICNYLFVPSSRLGDARVKDKGLTFDEGQHCPRYGRRTLESPRGF